MSQGDLANPFSVYPVAAGEGSGIPVSDEAVNGELHSIRRQYLTHERAVNSVGTLFFFSALLSLLASIMVVAAPFLYMLYANAPITGSAVLVCLVLSLCLIGLVILQALVAIAMRRKLKNARYAAMLLAAVGLLAIPFGTIFGIVVLMIMGAKETSYVLSEEYKKVIKATPQYDAAPVPWVWITLVVGAMIVVLGTLLLIG